MTEDLINEHVKWIVSVDRRLILMQFMKKHMIANASEVAQETQRSTQNISHAIKEFEDKDLIECLTPSKTTWKKYVLTDMGKTVMEKMDGKFI
ncbi:sugar-specific transcriptional regulator TrmB [Methanolobus mangrovi]|uniref:Sugar-specific transcriptional regulator TrmB n=1 Tax=Methanolobus mangrovi TaxID=3072977 RepID=A0AA51UH07_9EURY|nr:sugar-specific transcriptional regulator TrmB [Methanolobus mangrovi]WMW23010.1 sugar-specific transcriptional regulator TrmB [Methanolobus mangrovi]